MGSIQFGGKLTPELKARYAESPNWRDGSFQNLEETSMNISPFRIPRIFYKQFAHRQDKMPKRPLPVAPLDVETFLAPGDRSKFVWYGHSAVLMRMMGKTLLIDPMLGPNAAPISPFAIKRFSEDTLDLIEHLPEIDLLLLSHDHYDHLDYASIQKLAGKTKQYFVALGVKRHLVHWGIPAGKITEFDWWDTQSFGDIAVHYTPTRHFSGRGLRDRLKSLWGGWVFKMPAENIWFSGDGGYGQHFKEVGKRLGPFDFAFMECGQYNEDWPLIHLFPDECVQAAIDARAVKAMPVHWAGFYLSYQHTWSEPGEEFRKAAIAQGLPYSLPTLGKVFSASDTFQESWWEAYR